MKFKTTLVAIALAFAASSANANVTKPISFTGTTGFFGQAYDSAVSFTDIFTFNISPSFSAGVGADVLVGFTGLSFNANLTGFDLYDSSNTKLETGSIASGILAGLSHSGLLAGDYYLKVTGTTTTVKGGSYAGNIDLTLSPVPEPSAWAMMVAGLGMIGFMSVRRRQYF